MRICKSWDEVTIRQFVELSKLKYEDTIEYYMAAIAILAGVHVSVIEAMDIQEVRNLVKKIKFIDKLPERELVPTTIDVNGRRYNVILRVDLLRGGQYIDLKTYTKNEDAFVDNMHNVISIFLQPLERKWFAWRPMKYDGAKQMEIANDLLNHMTIGEAYPMAVFFLDSLGKFDRRYSRIYHNESVERGEGVEQTSKPPHKETYYDYWGWFIILDTLSGGDFTKWNYFLDIGVVELLNLLSFQKDKIEEHNRQIDDYKRSV